jgi:bromodomain adjacent to zinc finger domain protein 1A
LREVLTQLLFAPTSTDENRSPSVSSRASSPSNPPVLCESSKPADCYYALPPADRIATLAFMCNIAVSSKAIHSHMEGCEEQLTALRKEKIEVNRLKKQ